MNAPLLVPPKRCAVYCRVSSDERLDQSFNSIDAQKEAGHAFIKSQSHEGWIAVADDYDDGGFSGGNMERPALRRLMADIQMGKVDIVVVYKIDRCRARWPISRGWSMCLTATGSASARSRSRSTRPPRWAG
jgi:site-specific DNA recombinase